ncbi:uncharacterized protein BT62DRAFT_1009339 [Guyanagaster necrorhizus]|uniref:Uncharacterized protein n=1 Tax=Guyanagaster necrorhizus TaxID=856835 RepID=A0A9P7VPA9_9AGAR|nr:uncharacterized protein BT62DRAFT_1009339 [Guyanagaster necrorhizus MCA 3950]KAG7443519.1 hypothetical protein BT62DRAFT_1009339 [Guyanagaster necrorhizus MCA 3950]
MRIAALSVPQHPSSPVLITIQLRPNKGTEWSSLCELIEGRCPSLFDNFKVRGLNRHVPEGVPAAQDAPIIVVLTGFTGDMCPRDGILSPACAPIDRGGLGYRAVVVNFRGLLT